MGDSNSKKNNNSYTLFVIGTYLLIFVLWFAKILIFDGFINNMTEWGKALANSFFKCIILIPIPYLLIKNKKVEVSLKEMFTTKINFDIFGPIAAAFVVKCIVEMFSRFGGLQISDNFHPSDLLVSFLLVGITEELLFRGWIYNALLTCMSENGALILQALLFTSLHFPVYIMSGVIFSMNYVLLFILGVIFGWTFRKNRSIWTPIILHMMWDLAMLLVM